MSNTSIITSMEKTLNAVDPRLIDHGKRVAYLIYKILKIQNLFSKKELHDICILALLHDIGAYKTEDIDKMLVFETTDVWEHSIYGYMFLKYFSPLSHWAPIILYHHNDWEKMEGLKDTKHQLLAQLISLCDRADISHVYEKSSREFISYINQSCGVKYREDVYQMYLEAQIDIERVFDDMSRDQEFHDFLYDTPMIDSEVKHYLQLMMYTINFRNEQHVNRSFISGFIPANISRFCKLEEVQIRKIKKDYFIKSLEEMGFTKKQIKYAKQKSLSGFKLSNKDFVEDMYMISRLFQSIYGSTGYKNSNTSVMVLEVLEDLMEFQGMKAMDFVWAMEGNQ